MDRRWNPTSDSRNLDFTSESRPRLLGLRYCGMASIELVLSQRSELDSRVHGEHYTIVQQKMITYKVVSNARPTMTFWMPGFARMGSSIGTILHHPRTTLHRKRKNFFLPPVQSSTTKCYIRTMETVITNPDTNVNVKVKVDEGPLPYTVELTFGKSYSLTMSLEDARELAQLLAAVGADY